MTFLGTFKNLKWTSFIVSAMAIRVEGLHSPPEVKLKQHPPTISNVEAPCAADRARFNTIMDNAARKAFEQIKLFATKMCIPGISVAVAINGEAPFVQCYGYCDVENAIPMLPETRVRVGGLCGMFTRLLLCKCEDMGAFIQEAVSEHIQVPSIFQRLSVAHLISHRSGISDISTEDLYSDTTQPVFNTLAESVAHDIAGIPLGNPNYEFSRINDLMLSAVYESKIQNAPGGGTFRNSLTQFFSDFGMSNTVLENYGSRIDHMSSHYIRAPGGMGVIKPREVNFTHRFGAFGVLSTARDLAVFARQIVILTQYQGGEQGGLTTQNILNSFANFDGDGGRGYSGREEEGRPRLGYHSTIAFKALDPLPYNGVDKEEPDGLLYQDGSGIGSSSLIYMRNCYMTRPQLPPRRNAACLQRCFDGTVVSIVCNLEDVKLFELADKIATNYEQAYKLFEDEREERTTGFF